MAITLTVTGETGMDILHHLTELLGSTSTVALTGEATVVAQEAKPASRARGKTAAEAAANKAGETPPTETASAPSAEAAQAASGSATAVSTASAEGTSSPSEAETKSPAGGELTAEAIVAAIADTAITYDDHLKPLVIKYSQKFKREGIDKLLVKYGCEAKFDELASARWQELIDDINAQLAA